MFLTISDLLLAEDLVSIRADLGALRWQDGAMTAGHAARRVKANQQADLTSRTGTRLRVQLSRAIQSHPVLEAAAQPARFSKIILSKTETGGGYGTHVDNAFMGSTEGSLRTDLSYTLFLSDPSDYEGGELSVDTPFETKSFKPDAGTLILYPTRFLHEVKPVTKGKRFACVGWIESRVRSTTQREILFDLENLSATLAKESGSQSNVSLTLSKIIANLKREFN